MLNVAADAAAAAWTSSMISEEGIVGVLADDESAVSDPAAEDVGESVDDVAAFSLRFASFSSSFCLSLSYVVNENKKVYSCQLTQTSHMSSCT